MRSLAAARSPNAPGAWPAGGSSSAPHPADTDPRSAARRHARARGQALGARPDAACRQSFAVEVAQPGAPDRGRGDGPRAAAAQLAPARGSAAAETATLPGWVMEGVAGGSCSTVRAALARAPGAGALRADELERLAQAIAVEPDTGCWRWLRAQNSAGYGVVWFRRQLVLVHRLILALHEASPRRKRLALHSCDHRPCCNPAHLRWGSHSENNRDQYARCRRTAPGQLAFFRSA